TFGNLQPPTATTAAATGAPAISVLPDALSGLLAGEQISIDDLKSGKMGTAFALQSSKSASFTVAVSDRVTNTQNVVAMVEGSDRKLKDECVACGAHYDHLGIRQGGTGDNIYNGADDDGSGTVSILEIAHAFATGPKPKRSILFVWHCGEEKGLWGSDY